MSNRCSILLHECAALIASAGSLTREKQRSAVADTRATLRGTLIAIVSVVGVVLAYPLAHWALIEVGREVIVLRTENLAGDWNETRRYRARVVPGPHPEIHALLRAKYGIADRWVRFVGADDEFSAPVALEPIE